jgi:hypothetical protein
MHIGVGIFPTDQTIGAIELAREVALTLGRPAVTNR